MRVVYLISLSLFILHDAVYTQCVTNINLNTWGQVGWAANGNWTPQNGGTTVYQSINGDPTFFISPYNFMNVRIAGNFKTTDGDNDYMGFVFSFLNPLGQSDTFDTWLFDWKQGQQGSAQAGKSLCRAKGVIPPSDYTPTFWNHQNTPAFTVVADDFPGAGWVTGYNHSFELILTFTRAIIYIDGQLVFDHPDCYVPGRFGFYNYSQAQTTYSNFQYGLSIDFSVVDSEVCLGNETDFRFVNPCPGYNYNLNQYASLHWDFGDGQSQTITSPTLNNVNVTHTYAQPGTYTATLIVVDVLGCSDTATRQVTVLGKTQADFNAPSICEGSATSFTDASTGTPTSWSWDFGDNATSSAASPIHTYSTNGTYSVSLIANNANNCPDTVTKQVTVFNGVTAGFTKADECFGDSISFTDNSSGPVVNYLWSFGDGTSSSDINPIYLYSASGNYNVQQIVSSTDGCSDTATQTVQVFPKPEVQFAAANVCSGKDMSFTNSSSISSGAITNYLWSFGDGDTSSSASPQHLYSASGSYNVVLIAVSDHVCYDSVSRQFQVHPNPISQFTTGPVCLNSATIFSNTSTISNGTIAQYFWDFGDGQNSTQQQPTHSYAAFGNYQVSLVAVSDSACVDTFSAGVMVYDKPVAAYGVTEVCQNLPSVFSDTSTIQSGSIAQWHYLFGDGDSSILQSATHTYDSAGIFSSQLIVTSDQGCTDTALRAVIVNPLPQVSFSAPDLCLGNPTVFTNTSQITTGSITAWNWNFADGNTSNSAQPTNTYQAAGTYSVTLSATSDKGCEDSASLSIVVFENPSIVTSSTPACYQDDNGTLSATGSSGTTPYTYLWDNGASAADVSDLFAGAYSLTVTDANQCSATATQTVSEPSGPLTVSVNPDPAQIEIGTILDMNLTNSYQDGQAVYALSPTYGLSCATCAQFQAFPYQTTDYQVQVTDSLGCPGTGSFTIQVNEALPLFIPNAFTPNHDGENDTWGIFSRGVKYLRLKVFNRSGEKVFETNNPNTFWDGTFRGQPAAPGVYVYVGRVVFLSNESRALKGTVTLLR